MLEKDFINLPNFSYAEMYKHYRSKGFSDRGARVEIKKVKPHFMRRLQVFRTLIGRPVFYNCLTEGKHKGKTHPEGIAGDIRIGGKGKFNPNKILQSAIEAGFKGIGWYPFWNKPGFHVDSRKESFKCWKRLKNGEYVGLI